MIGSHVAVATELPFRAHVSDNEVLTTLGNLLEHVPMWDVSRGALSRVGTASGGMKLFHHFRLLCIVVRDS